MNLILFEPAETTAPLPRDDPRAVHLLKVLHRQPGDTFDAGLIDGPRGKGTLIAADERTLTLRFAWSAEPPPLDPVTLIIGLPRPQTARDILRDATTLGVSVIHFAATERAEANYARSSLWRHGEWRRLLIAGAEQAFCTRLPQVTVDRRLTDLLAALPPGGARLALDNYEASTPLARIQSVAAFVTLAIGPERGWSAGDRELLRAHRFEFVHLGPRVLRTETAVVAALTLAKAKLGSE